MCVCALDPETSAILFLIRLRSVHNVHNDAVSTLYHLC